MSQPSVKNTLVLTAVQELQETCTPVTRARLVRHLFERDPAAWCIPGDLGLPDSKRVDACVSKLIQHGHLDHVGPSEYEAPVRRSKAPPGPPPSHLQLVPPAPPPAPKTAALTAAELWKLAGMSRSPIIGKARRGGSPLTLRDAREMFGLPQAEPPELALAADAQLALARAFVSYQGETPVSARARVELLNVCTVLKGIVDQANLSSQAG